VLGGGAPLFHRLPRRPSRTLLGPRGELRYRATPQPTAPRPNENVLDRCGEMVGDALISRLALHAIETLRCPLREGSRHFEASTENPSCASREADALIASGSDPVPRRLRIPSGAASRRRAGDDGTRSPPPSRPQRGSEPQGVSFPHKRFGRPVRLNCPPYCGTIPALGHGKRIRWPIQQPFIGCCPIISRVTGVRAVGLL
jgi:hypothetical protein